MQYLSLVPVTGPQNSLHRNNDNMASSPKQDYDEADLFGPRALSEPSSDASSAVLSSDSWQTISHELPYDEHSDAFDDAPDCPGILFQAHFPIMSDSSTANPGSCSSFNPEDVLRSTNDLAMRLSPPQAARPTGQHSWTDADVQGLGRTTSMDLASSSLLVHAGDPMEIALSSDEPVVAYDPYDSMTWTATDGGTPILMPEPLSGLSLRRYDNSDREDHKIPWELGNTWECGVNGCTKQFSQQHRYKYVSQGRTP